MKIIAKILVVALALLLTAYVVPGITVTGWLPAVLAALLLGIINLMVRPVLIILTLPVTILTLGVFIIILNALLLWFTAFIIDGFTIHGFVAAVLGTLIVSLCSWVGNHLLVK